MARELRTVSAKEFKSRCLQLLDEVSVTGQPLVITKRGRPIARVVPVESLLGSVREQGDIIEPVLWDAEV